MWQEEKVNCKKNVKKKQTKEKNEKKARTNKEKRTWHAEKKQKKINVK